VILKSELNAKNKITAIGALTIPYWGTILIYEGHTKSNEQQFFFIY
jgi:hypothetical protein